ncbi:MAG: hypothetical protein R3E58_00095 [Phycisphaerae bacterium]
MCCRTPCSIATRAIHRRLADHPDDQRNLRERGNIEHKGISASSGFEDSRMWLLSEVAFATVFIDLDEPQPIAELTLISEQELLDAGLIDCVDSARLSGRTIFYFEGNAFCGTFVPFSTFPDNGRVGCDALHRKQLQVWAIRAS